MYVIWIFLSTGDDIIIPACQSFLSKPSRVKKFTNAIRKQIYDILAYVIIQASVVYIALEEVF